MLVMHDSNLNDNEQSAGLPAVYAIETATESWYGQSPITMKGYVHEQENDLCWQQASSKESLSGPPCNEIREDILTVIAPISHKPLKGVLGSI